MHLQMHGKQGHLPEILKCTRHFWLDGNEISKLTISADFCFN